MRLFRVELDNLSKVKSQKQMFMIELIFTTYSTKLKLQVQMWYIVIRYSC